MSLTEVSLSPQTHGISVPHLYLFTDKLTLNRSLLLSPNSWDCGPHLYLFRDKLTLNKPPSLPKHSLSNLTRLALSHNVVALMRPPWLTGREEPIIHPSSRPSRMSGPASTSSGTTRRSASHALLPLPPSKRFFCFDCAAAFSAFYY